MADDLSNLDENEPVSSGPVHEGDDEIRKTRLHVKNWADIEHHETGEHKFLAGGDGILPAFGTAGRLFYHTDERVILRDTGSAWVHLATVPSYINTPVDVADLPQGTFIGSTIATISDIKTRTGAKIFAVGYAATTEGLNSYSARIMYDGGAINPTPVNFGPQASAAGADPAVVFPIFGVVPSPAAGTHTMSLDMFRVAAGPTPITNIIFAVFVF